MKDICSVCNKPIAQYDCRSVVTTTTIWRMHKACDRPKPQQESSEPSGLDVSKLLVNAIAQVRRLHAELDNVSGASPETLLALDVLMYCAAQEVLNGSPDAQDYEERFGKSYDVSAYERLAKRDM